MDLQYSSVSLLYIYSSYVRKCG